MLIKNKKFNTVAKTWLLFKRFSVKKSTFYKYKYIIDKYILFYFKKKRIYYFVNYDFNRYVKQLSEKLSVTTINNILIVFKSLLKYIETKYNLDLKLNLICTLKEKNKNIEILNKHEITMLEDYCYSTEEFKILGVQFALTTGNLCFKMETFRFKKRLCFSGKYITEDLCFARKN